MFACVDFFALDIGFLLLRSHWRWLPTPEADMYIPLRTAVTKFDWWKHAWNRSHCSDQSSSHLLILVALSLTAALLKFMDWNSGGKCSMFQYSLCQLIHAYTTLFPFSGSPCQVHAALCLVQRKTLKGLLKRFSVKVDALPCLPFYIHVSYIYIGRYTSGTYRFYALYVCMKMHERRILWLILNIWKSH